MANEQGEWLPYREAAARLGISLEAVRQKSIRGAWPKMRANDGKALIRPPEGWPNAPAERGEREQPAKPNRANEQGVRSPPEQVAADRLFRALEDHVATLKQDVATREAEIATARADIAALRSDLASERAEREAATARIARLEAALDAEAAKIEAERRRTAEAIRAHLDLAEKIAADRARPWWRRLVG